MRKKDSQIRHAQLRFSQRTSIYLSKDVMARFVRQIQVGSASFVQRQSNRVTIWDILDGETTYRVVYDRDRKNIVTIIPNDGLSVRPDDRFG